MSKQGYNPTSNNTVPRPTAVLHMAHMHTCDCDRETEVAYL